MSKLTTTSADTARQRLTGTFAATGQSASATFGPGEFNLALWGTFVATVKLEKSFDGGTTWISASTDLLGTPASYTAPMAVAFSEAEANVLYRLNCSAFTSGTVNYRVSR